jgi:hypothetical protein
MDAASGNSLVVLLGIGRQGDRSDVKRRRRPAGCAADPEFMADCLGKLPTARAASGARVTLKTHRGRRREAWVASPSASALAAARCEVFRPSTSPAAVRGPVKLEPMSRRRPLSSTRAGGVEVRSRCAHRSSTRAGPFDAVIDFVRSQRLESSACLLLPPALRLSRALFRCLRCLPSLLRHAALLAMSEWRCRPVPAGIANTVLPITTAEQKHQRFRWIERARLCVDTTSCVSTSMTDAHSALRDAIAHHRAQIF